MRLATLRTNEGPRVAAFRDGQYFDITAGDPRLPNSVKQILADALVPVARAALEKARPLAATGQSFLAPVPDPQKVVCVGLNYADHARESGVEPPAEPVLFNKFPTALIGAEQPIVLPGVSDAVDYEAELVVVIGRPGRDIPRAKAMDHVAGYTLGNDVSARDWQLNKPSKQWLLGKSFDTFAPTGPHFVTADEIDPSGLQVQFRLNGETMQNSNTREFIFKLDELIAYVSQVCTLLPGDLIFTGTPPGVGFARKPPVLLKPGDVCEVEIAGLGVLRNPVVAAQ